MHHKMKLNPKSFEKIKSGEKTIEIRLFDEKRQKLSIGDNIEFTNPADRKENIIVEVVDLLQYSKFENLIADKDMKCFGCKENYSKEKFLKGIYEIYTQEQERIYGVLGIEIKLNK